MMNAVLTFDSARGRQTSGPELARATGGNKVIPFRPSSRPAPLAAANPAPSLPRRPAVPPPVRAETPSRAAEPAPQPVRLARLVHMASVGGYVAVLNGSLVELDGRMVWPTAEALLRDAAAADMAVSTLIIDTARS
ncbi:hypothetical protein [Azospirillum isscasi]|uniref:BON domain-containing protein n=1 Tax=Azospirillum isscasi TaxID=3053926 RepID=A0ABU0WJ99_9PROT|nr:hypothetical protein [Azospirillum isscasi]MDQ2104298.1 hypothetical protein [Azospirillum isscasi]